MNIVMPWKSFNLDVRMIVDHTKTLAPDKIHGATTDDLQMNLICDESISQEEIDEIQSYLDSLTEESDECIEYRTEAQIQQCIESLKAGIPAKTWNQLTGPERKIILGQSPSKAELIAAELL